MRVGLLGFIVLFSFPFFAQAKHPFTFEDMMALKRVEEPVVSPDGKNILFKSDVYPECDGTPAAEADCNAKKVEDAKNSKVKALIFTHLLYRHWNAYKEGKRTHLFVLPVNGCATTHVGPDALVWAGEPGSPSVEQSSDSRASLDRTGEGTCPYVSVPRDL